MANLLDLVSKFVRLKAAEVYSIGKRKECGEQIGKLLASPPEGSKTHKVGEFKVTITRKINRVEVDFAAMRDVDYDHPPIKPKSELDVEGLKWIRENEPEVYLQYAKLFTSKFAAVGVKVVVPK